VDSRLSRTGNNKSDGMPMQCIFNKNFAVVGAPVLSVRRDLHAGGGSREGTRLAGNGSTCNVIRLGC